MDRSDDARFSDEFLSAVSAAINRAERALRRSGLAASFPGIVAEEVLGPIRQLDIIVKPSTGGRTIPIDDLIGEMAVLDYENGFTFSPILDENDEFMTPNDGHCVALPGSNCPVEPASAAATEPSSSAPPETHDPLSEAAIRRLSAWARYMKPVFDTGLVWLGGYRRRDGGFDTEATLVFDSERRAEAYYAAKEWKQESYWTIHQNGSGELTELDGVPPSSVFESLFPKSN